MKTQADYIDCIRSLCNAYKCPLVIAGDIFDDGWRPRRCSPELINWAITQFQMFKHPIYAIPGQHDLPMHRRADIHKSAYWTLAQSQIKDLEWAQPHRHCFQLFDRSDPRPDLVLFGFPWGTNVEDSPSLRFNRAHTVNLAVVHDYCWCEGHSFPGCPQEKHVDEWRKRLKWFDAAVFGDNHKAFRDGTPTVRPYIMNTGTLTRRRSDEQNYHPRVGLLHANGEIEQFGLPISKDKFTKVKALDITSENIDPSFIEFLNEIQDVAINFKEAMFRFFNVKKVPTPIKDMILEILESNND